MLQSAVSSDRRGVVTSVFVVTLIGLPQLVSPIVGPALSNPHDAVSRLRWGVVAGALILVATAAYLAPPGAKAKEAESS